MDHNHQRKKTKNKNPLVEKVSLESQICDLANYLLDFFDTSLANIL